MLPSDHLLRDVASHQDIGGDHSCYEYLKTKVK